MTEGGCASSGVPAAGVNLAAPVDRPGPLVAPSRAALAVPLDPGLEAHDDRASDAALVDLFVVPQVATRERVSHGIAVAARAVEDLQRGAARRAVGQCRPREVTL